MSAVSDERAAAPRRGILRLRQETMESMFGYAYAILMTDLLLVLANLPLAVLLLVSRDALQAWPTVLLFSLTLAPSLAGAFEVFRRMRGEEPPRPFAAFWHGYRSRGATAALLGLVTALVIGFVLYDGAILTGTVWASLLAPTFAVVAAWALVACTSSLAGLVLYPQASARAIVKAAVYLSVRRWYFSAFALVLLGISAAAVIVQPVLGALVPGLLLYVVFANAEFSFRRAVETEVAER
ncbi:YesL family protein [Microbacterium sp. NPDC089698]|uniref:YesL family protein n=1 Tax=Microbacterium sp. NPDC089698 TaxID=3364200 RepID=UPI003816E679